MSVHSRRAVTIAPAPSTNSASNAARSTGTEPGPPVPPGGAAVAACPDAAPCTRSVVRPGVNDLAEPLELLVWVPRTRYQPGLTFAGTGNVTLILPAVSGVTAGAITRPARVDRRIVTPLTPATLLKPLPLAVIVCPGDATEVLNFNTAPCADALDANAKGITAPATKKNATLRPSTPPCFVFTVASIASRLCRV